MRIPDTKLDLCAAKNDVRYHLNGVYLDVERARAIATNGRVAAIMPAEIEEGDQSGLIGTDVMLEARKRANVKLADGFVSIKATGAFELANGATFPRDPIMEDATFPDIDKVTPKYDGPCDIAFNAEYLQAIQDALCEKHQHGLAIWFGKKPDGTIDPMLPIKMTPLGDDSGRYGVLMPMRTK